MFLLSAFLVGFLGSFHCAGMCGPIALALPVSNSTRSSMLLGRLLYNAGRITTYSLLGLAIGLIGHTISIAGFQKGLSISSGVIIILVAAVSLLHTRLNFPVQYAARFTAAIKNRFRKYFSQKSWSTLFMIGTVNGFLPCGFVYLAMAAALGAGNALGSISYMAFFGLGTLPMMLFISLSGNLFGLRFNRLVNNATPYVAMAVAALLIVRGFNMTGTACCHH